MRSAVRVLATISVIGVCMAPVRANAQSIAENPTPVVSFTDTTDNDEQSTALVIPRALNIPASLPSFAAAPAAGATDLSDGRSIWWATTMAVAGPLADGLSTWWAMRQSGPRARVGEGNAFFHMLFGDNVKGSEILAFKVGQAALFGAFTHYVAKIDKERAVGSAILVASAHAVVTVFNVKNGLKAKRVNAVYSVSW
jgi:hypothetical protein